MSPEVAHRHEVAETVENADCGAVYRTTCSLRQVAPPVVAFEVIVQRLALCVDVSLERPTS